MADDYGFKYALYQKSLANKDPNDIGYSSKYNTLKQWLTGIKSVAAVHQALTTVTIPHGLPYRPTFNAYYRDTLSGNVYAVSSGQEGQSFARQGAEIGCHAKADNYNLTIEVWNNNATTDKNVDVFYEIFYEDLSTELTTTF